MVGGSNFRESQFNLATQAERQPGSSFKPIVLATALRQGISPVTTFDSKPVDIDAGDRVWHVTNYEGDYLGRVDLATAMVSSDNSVYAQLTKLVGPKAIVKTAHALGIRSELDPYFSIGLGAVAVNPLDMTRAYATFANRGVRVDGSLTGDRPRVVERVEFARTGRSRREPAGRQGRDDDRRGGPAHLDPAERRHAGDRQARRARRTGPAAGKTGTTDNYGDAWFVGYTPQLAVAVWVGYPDKLQPMLTEFGGKPVAGGTLPAQIWHAFMTAADKQLKLEPEQFPPTPYIPAQEQADRLARTARTSSTTATARARASSRTSPAAGRPRRRSATRTRSRCRSSSARRSTRPTRRSREQPLGSELIGVPAKTGKHPGYVVKQEPRDGFLSANDTVRLYVTRPDPRYGLLPNLVGSSVTAARSRLRKLKARTTITYDKGAAGRCSSRRRSPASRPGKGLKVTLVVGRATPSASP